MISNQKIKQEADGEASEKASAKVVKDNTQQLETNKRKKGEYINWFVLDLWPPVMAIVKKHVNDS
jgi:Asp-tRNA(Asn)/Glu-tRNA(Gln) amidotransferase B subunit